MKSRRSLFLIAITFSLSVLGAGCAKTEETQTTATKQQAAIQQQVSVQPETKKTLIEEKFDQNNAFGYIKSFRVNTTSTYITIDPAEMLNGKAAEQAAYEDGTCTKEDFAIPGGCTPNDFYIRNNSSSTVELPVSKTVIVTYLTFTKTGTPNPTQHSFSTFQKSFEHPETSDIYGPLNAMPYHFTVSKGQIIKIEQQYLP